MQSPTWDAQINLAVYRAKWSVIVTTVLGMPALACVQTHIVTNVSFFPKGEPRDCDGTATAPVGRGGSAGVPGRNHLVLNIWVSITTNFNAISISISKFQCL